MIKTPVKYVWMAVILVLLWALAAGCSAPGLVEPDVDQPEPEVDQPVNEIESGDEADYNGDEDLDLDDEEESEEPEEDIPAGADGIARLLHHMAREADPGFRPKTRTLEVEGPDGKDQMVFRLLNLPSQPFSTYIPGEPDTSPYFLLGPGHLWTMDANISQDREMVLIGRSGAGGQLDELDVALEIIIFGEDKDMSKAWAELMKGFETLEGMAPLEADLPAWVQEARVYSQGNERAGFLVLGRHDHITFGLRSTWMQDQEQSWLSLVHHVLEQWTWEEKTAQRPSEQIFTTFVEGMEEYATFCLVQRPSIPISTYFPCDRMSQVQEIDAGSAKGLRLGYMDIMFFEDSLERRGAEASFYQVLSYMGALEPYPEDEQPAWALAKYTGLQSNRSMTAILAEHSGRYFYIREEYPPEAGDGWYPIRSLILNQWRWNDTGESLGHK